MALVLPKVPRGGLSSRLPTSGSSDIMIRLAGLQPRYEPLDQIEFDVCLGRPVLSELAALEISVVWYTEGKGGEDLGVHWFQRITPPSLQEMDWRQPQRRALQLPASPWTYEGTILKIRWCVRVRAFFTDGQQWAAQEPFYLGALTREE